MVTTLKPKTYLYDVTFDFAETEDCLGPHIALTFDFQGGAASGYNSPLLLKSKGEASTPIFKSKAETITPQLISKLKEIGIDTSTLEKLKPALKETISPEIYAQLKEIAETEVAKNSNAFARVAEIAKSLEKQNTTSKPTLSERFNEFLISKNKGE